MTEPTNPNLVGEQRLRSLIDQLADQLCQAVDGRFDFAVRVEGQDETIEKLQMLINFVLDAAHRSLTGSEARAHDLVAKSQSLLSVNLELEREITERKRLQSEMELLARFPAENPSPVVRVASDGRVIYANAVSGPVLEAWGTSPEGYLPPPWPDTIAQVLGSGQSQTIDVRCGEKFLSFTLAPVVEAGYVNFFGQDITERVKAEVELLRSERQLHTITDNVPGMIAYVDSDERYRFVNKQYAKRFHLNQEVILGKTVHEIFGTSQYNLIKHHIETALSGESVRYENQVEDEQGNKVWLGAAYVPDTNEQGHVQGFYALVHDITEQKQAEAERDALNRELVEKTEELERQKAQLVEEVAQRMRAEARARQDAMHDSLTGLSNRAVLLDRIERCLQRTKREKGYVFALLFLDFDRFKIINDSLGHEVGDQLLISIADRLQGNLRAGDTASRVDQEPDPANNNLSVRLGGDEFVILLDGIKNVEDATLVAERMQQSLQTPHKIGTHEVTATASIGIVTSDLGYDSADEMLRDADTAMYRAKAAGRARHQLFDRAMHNEAVARLELENDLRQALQHEQFHLVYQPIVDLQTGLAVGMEALMRWDHPERGVIPPIDFIPVAEEIGLIVPIGRWVLLEACQQLKQWQEQFPRESPLCMNVNISKRQLTQSDLVKTIQNVLTTTGIEPRTLKLEITETAIMDNPDELNPVLQRLRACGVFLCIDDFGTGHSSLSCLHEFSIDVLKIDRSFLINMKGSRAYAAVTQAIVTLAHNLGMDVVAEGVETPEQVALLQALEADFAQGYYFARPLRPEDAAAFLQNQPPLAKSA